MAVLHSSPTADWTPSDLRRGGGGGESRAIFLGQIFLPFHTVHRVLITRILEWFAIPSSSGPITFCQNSPL